MRLTLRTLLAYLDDTLEPVAAKELGLKLAETPAAQELVTRLKEVTRRRRLTAPPLVGDEIDPNLLAEYLDSLLPADAVARVEGTCLESDVHLAEVAACHQVLTLIGQPASTSDSMRQRMYSLVSSLESIPPERRAAARPEVAPLPVPSLFLQRTLAARVLTGAALVVGAIGIGFLVWISLHPSGRGGAGEAPPRSAGPEAEPPGHFIPSHRESEPTELEFPAMPPELEPKVAESKGEPDRGQPPVQEPADRMVEKQAAATEPAPPGTEGRSEPSAGQPGKAEQVKAETARPEPGMTEPAKAEPAAPRAEAGKAEVGEPAPAVEKPRVVVATYRSTSGVLLRPDEAGREWRRIRHGEDLYDSDHLLTLPAFRSTVQLSSGASLDLVGETELELATATEGLDGHVRLDRGQLVLSTNQVQATVLVEFQGQAWRIVLKSPETVAGISLVPVWRPGGPFFYEATLYVPRGELELGAAGQSRVLGGPVQVHWDSASGLQEPASLGFPPGWMEKDELAPSEVRAAATLQADLGFDGPIGLSLIDATTTERKELRLLGVQCLGAIGRLPALIDCMKTMGKRDLRQAAVAALRRHMARGKAQEEALAQSLFVKFNKSQEHADGVSALLRGYSEADFQQMKGKDYENLIALLAGDRDIALRELAIMNLEDLAGRPLNSAYNPDKPRDSDIAAWRRALDDGRLPPKVRGKM